jgi:hypothetical protein
MKHAGYFSKGLAFLAVAGLLTLGIMLAATVATVLINWGLDNPIPAGIIFMVIIVYVIGKEIVDGNRPSTE